jgi:succinoglycan biosynthesis transport protein ExoP
MEEEIDLREYIDVLMRRWKWIAALTLVAALAAAAVSFFVLSPTYEASALVLITGPRYQLEFDPRVVAVDEFKAAFDAYPGLALSDDLLKGVLAALDPPLPPEEARLGALRGKMSARAGADPSLLKLTVNNGDPERAARIANTWAERYVDYVDNLYGRRDEDAAFFSQQLEEARAALQAAEGALTDFEARNEYSTLSAQLSSLRQTQSDYLAEQRSILRLNQDIASLQAQLAGGSSARASTLGDDLTALFLQIKAFNAQSSMPLQLQVTTTESLSGRTVAEQIAFLEELATNLEAKSTAIDALLTELQPRILSLQEALQAVDTEQKRLNRDRTVAETTYITLANKVEEARIAAQDETGEVQLASRASVPTSPTGPRKLMNTAVAAFLGLFLGVFAAFFVEFWQAPRAGA